VALRRGTEYRQLAKLPTLLKSRIKNKGEKPPRSSTTAHCDQFISPELPDVTAAMPLKTKDLWALRRDEKLDIKLLKVRASAQQHIVWRLLMLTRCALA